jgi:beta-glucanase (GH16 family)
MKKTRLAALGIGALCTVGFMTASTGCNSKNDKADKSKGKLVWSDEFDYKGLPDPNKWYYDVGGTGWGNNELQYYTKDRVENAEVKNGRLVITVRKEEYKGKNYTSARLLTKGNWLYGRVEVKAKLPKGRGTWPAIWMLPTEWAYGGWPKSGEIDIMEHVGYDMNVIHGSTHSLKYYFKENTQKTNTIKIDNVDSEFHVYSMEWSPNRVVMLVDEKPYFEASFDEIKDKEDAWKAWPFDKSFNLLLNIAVGGDWGGAKGVDDSIWPQTMEVDYVRVYDMEASKEKNK